MNESGKEPRPRDHALEEELESLHEQEHEGHSTAKEHRRAEQLEHRLEVDEHGEAEREREQEEKLAEQEDEEFRHRHRHH
jgi:hypothetical protein